MHSRNTRTARLYARVSTDEQAKGDSLALQITRLTDIAHAAGYERAVAYVDAGVSGSIPLSQREQGALMLADAEAGDCVFVIKLDRFGRNLADIATTADALAARGIGLSASDVPGDIARDTGSRMMFGIMATMADAERRRIRERIKDAKAAHTAMGNRFVSGSTPFGYAKVEDQHGKGKHGIAPIAHIHALARKLRAQGYSANAAAGAMRAELGEAVSSRAVSRLWSKLESAEA